MTANYGPLIAQVPEFFEFLAGCDTLSKTSMGTRMIEHSLARSTCQSEDLWGLYCGIDLHSNNHVLSLIDEADRRVYERRLSNDLAKAGT